MTNDPENSRTRYQTASITRQRRGGCEPACRRIGANSCCLGFVWGLIDAVLWQLLSYPGADVSNADGGVHRPELVWAWLMGSVFASK